MKEWSVVLLSVVNGKPLVKIFSAPLELVQDAMTHGLWRDLERWDVTDLVTCDISIDRGSRQTEVNIRFNQTDVEVDPILCDVWMKDSEF